MIITKKMAMLEAALRSCVAVMDRDLNGLALIQPELKESKQALEDMYLVDAEFEPWNGEGLPPVGAELECGFACEGFKTWHKGVCVAIGIDPEDRGEICVVKSGEKIAMYTAYGGRMRPIRTPEQTAAEERQKSVNELAEHIAGYMGRDDAEDLHRGMAAYLHDNHYRKQVQP